MVMVFVRSLCFLCCFWLVTHQLDSSYLRFRGVTKYTTQACTILWRVPFRQTAWEKEYTKYYNMHNRWYMHGWMKEGYAFHWGSCNCKSARPNHQQRRHPLPPFRPSRHHQIPPGQVEDPTNNTGEYIQEPLGHRAPHTCIDILLTNLRTADPSSIIFDDNLVS